MGREGATVAPHVFGYEEGAPMAGKDKGGSKSSKTAASKTLKEKRQAKKAKAAGSNPSSSGSWTNK
jgi:hypothetical protein